MRRLLFALLLTLACGSSALAQNARHCAPREAIITRLAEKFGESRQGLGLGRNNAVMEIFANLQSGSWTIIATLANGTSCIIASGEAYQARRDPLPPDGDAL